MKPLRRNSSEGEGEVRIAPLVDIVFILLVFFVVASTFISERGLKTNTADSLPETTREVENVSLRLSRNGELTWQGRQIEITSLSRTLTAEGIDDSGTVSLELEVGVLMSSVTRVIDTLALNGLGPIILKMSEY